MPAHDDAESHDRPNVRRRSESDALAPSIRWMARQWWVNLAAGLFLLLAVLSGEQRENAPVAIPVAVLFVLAGLALLANLVRERRGK